MSELLNYLVQNEDNFRRARLPALYSDFRHLHSINPDGFAANISAWKHGLSAALLAGQIPSKSSTRNHFTLEVDEQLLRSLESKQYGRPLALGTVLQDAASTGEMLPLQTFSRAKDSIYHKSWTSVPWTVVSWGLRQMGLVGGPGAGDDRIPKGSFVVLENLEAAAKAFAEATADLHSPFERTFSRAHFQRAYAASLLPGQQQRLSEQDLELLVKFLVRDKGVLAADGQTVKILAAGEPAAVTEEDAAVASLKQLMEDLGAQTAALSRRVDELAAAAQDAVRRKSTVAARAALKSKKLAEANLATRYATLAQLEDVAAKIQQAADNVALVGVMRSSTAALRGLNARVGPADKVDELFDELREQMGQVDEVGNVIAEPGAEAAASVDEAEVDEEFEAMLAQEREKEEAAERKRKEAEQEKQAEETRQKLAELEKLGPVGGAPEATKAGKPEHGPPTPVTAAADELGEMKLDTEADRVQVAAE